MERGGVDPGEELLLAAGRGDVAAWTEFRRLGHPLVAGWALRHAGEELAAELVAETFAAALLASPDYLPGETSVRAWLLAIAERTLRVSRRRGRIGHGARRRAALERVGGAEGALALSDAPVVLDPGTAIRHLLAELSACQREVVVARVVEERGYGEIAAELRCSEAAARACVSCGLNALRGRLPAAR